MRKAVNDINWESKRKEDNMKTKKAFLTVCLTLVFAVGMSVTGECGPQKGDILISPMIGGHLFEGTMNIDHGPMGALGLGYMATDRCGLEAVVGYTMTETSVGGLDANILTGHLDGFYNLLTDGAFIPYFAVGVGGAQRGGQLDAIADRLLGGQSSPRHPFLDCFGLGRQCVTVRRGRVCARGRNGPKTHQQRDDQRDQPRCSCAFHPNPLLRHPRENESVQRGTRSTRAPRVHWYQALTRTIPLE